MKGQDRFLTVATTRPETMLGDTAVAVHPDDPRYRDLVGKTVILPLLDREIPVIADATLVDPEFGTGVVKVTPAHDFNDYQTGLRHKLAMISILDEAARTNEAAGPYAGLDRFEARKRVLADLEARGLLVSEKPHTLSIGLCQRSAHHRRAAAVTAVVRPHRAAGPAGDRGGGAGKDDASSPRPGTPPTSTGCATSRTGA